MSEKSSTARNEALCVPADDSVAGGLADINDQSKEQKARRARTRTKRRRRTRDTTIDRNNSTDHEPSSPSTTTDYAVEGVHIGGDEQAPPALRRTDDEKQNHPSSGRTTSSSKQQQRVNKKQEKFHRKLRHQQERRRLQQPSQLDFAQQLSRQLSRLERTFEEAKDHDCTSNSPPRTGGSLAEDDLRTQPLAANHGSPRQTSSKNGYDAADADDDSSAGAKKRKSKNTGGTGVPSKKRARRRAV
jgi:hypothetical protein